MTDLKLDHKSGFKYQRSVKNHSILIIKMTRIDFNK